MCSNGLVCSSFEELQVPVPGFWCEREFRVDFRGDAAAVCEDELDVFEAESFGAEDGGERVSCGVWAAFLLEPPSIQSNWTLRSSRPWSVGTMLRYSIVV